mgnify:CR=1 FL=1
MSSLIVEEDPMVYMFYFVHMIVNELTSKRRKTLETMAVLCSILHTFDELGDSSQRLYKFGHIILNVIEKFTTAPKIAFIGFRGFTLYKSI